MIYDPAEHEALADRRFDREEARTFVVDTVRLIDASFDPDSGWPLHPEDDYGEGKGPASLGVYNGEAGTMWALSRLAERYEVALRHDYGRAIERTEERFDSLPSAERVPSYPMGIGGIAFVRYLLTKDESALERSLSAAERNSDNPTREFLWGSPGTAFPSLLLRERDGGARFDASLRSVHDELWSSWEPEDEDGGLLWVQDMYGQRRRYIGAGHGAVANIGVLLRSLDLLGADRRMAVTSRLRAMLQRYAMVEGNAVNWYSSGGPSSGIRLQWCHGAPGIITSLAALDPTDDVVEELLQKGGNAVWEAGPVLKGPSLCHGTAGNGFALLRLASRTGDEIWLQRARRFAMHAIGQAHAWRAEFGMPGASLWTGDLGVALYVDAAIRNDPRILSLDVT